MFEQSPYLVPPYSALAEVYDRAGLSDYTRDHVHNYINYVQSIGWAGRRVLDLGCGTGVSSWLVAGHDLRVAGIDASSHMLARAQAREKQNNTDNGSPMVFDPPSFYQMDIRELESPLGEVDLVLAMGGVLNAIQSLRDLETVFHRVHGVLEDDKLFVFDIRTIRGLSSNSSSDDMVLYDNGYNLIVIVRSQFSFETLSCTQQVIMFQQQDLAWDRKDEVHIERGYPAQGISALLERAGFSVVAVLSPDLSPFDPMVDPEGRAVFVAQKHA